MSGSAHSGSSALRALLLGCLVLFASPHQAYCCMCFSEPLCNRRSSNDRETAILTGTVIDLYPNSMGFDAHLRASADRTALARAKVELLRRWRGVLSAEEVHRIQRATSRDQLSGGWLEIGPYSRRVRFQVGEWLAGGSGRTLELFTDVTSCGYQFESGKTYLVVAFRNVKTGRWQTGACSRSAPVGSKLAQEDLRALRAARDGHPLPPRIYGNIYDRRERKPAFDDSRALPHALLRLVGESSNRETRSDSEGWFAFDNLPPARYRLEVLEPAARGHPTEIDLIRDRCAEASGFVEGAGEDSIYRVYLHRFPTVPPRNNIVLEEPELVPPPTVPWQIPPVLIPTFPPLEGGNIDRPPPSTPPVATKSK